MELGDDELRDNKLRDDIDLSKCPECKMCDIILFLLNISHLKCG